MGKKCSLTNVLAERMSNVESAFNEGASQEELRELEQVCGQQLPDSFKNLYQCINGEKEYIGSMLGFSLMEVREIIDDYREQLEAQMEIISFAPGVIKEGTLHKGHIPFANDGGGSYLVLDLEPDVKGKRGQIITLDLESEISYVLADDIEALIQRIHEFFEKSLFILCEDDDKTYFTWHSGHLFNNAKEWVEGEFE